MSSGEHPTGRQPDASEHIAERDEETSHLMLQADRILARLMRDETRDADAAVGQAPMVLRSAERALVRARRLARRMGRGGETGQARTFDEEVGALTAALDALVDDRRQGQGALSSALERLIAVCRHQARERVGDLSELRGLAAGVLQLGRSLEPCSDAATTGRLEALGAALGDAEPAVLVPRAEAVLHDLTTAMRRRQTVDQSEAQRLHGEIGLLRQSLARVEAERASAHDAVARLTEQDATARTRRDRLLATIPLLRTAVQVNQGAIEMASGEIAAANARIAVMGEERQEQLDRQVVAEEECLVLQERIRQANERSVALRQHGDQLVLALAGNEHNAALVHEQELAAQELAHVRMGMRDLLERSVQRRRDAEQAEGAAERLARSMEQARAALRSSQRRLAELTVRCRSLSEECDRLQAEVGTAETVEHDPPPRPSTAAIPALPPSTRRRKRRITATDDAVPRLEEVEPTWIDDPARQPGEGPSAWGGEEPPSPPSVVTATGTPVAMDPGDAAPAMPPAIPLTNEDAGDMPPSTAPTTTIAAITRRVLVSNGTAPARPALRIDTRRAGASSSARPAVPALPIAAVPLVVPASPVPAWNMAPMLRVLLALGGLLLVALVVLGVLLVRDRQPRPVLAATSAAPVLAATIPLPLHEGFTASDPLQARVAEDGGAVLAGGRLSAVRPALADALIAAGDFALELRCRAAAPSAGPACLLAWGRDRQAVNLAVIQDGATWQVRLRTTGTQPDGTRPHLLTAALTAGDGERHLRLVRADGRLTLLLDGAAVATAVIPGGIDAWDRQAPLVLGGMPDGVWPWCGTVREVVVHVAGGAPQGP